MKPVLLALIITLSSCSMSQELPYHQIPDAPDNYSANSMISRMIDGLGYRYYWASKDLRPEDLKFKPSDEARTTRETLEHVYGLSLVIVNTVKNVPTGSSENLSQLSYEKLRSETLFMLKEASDLARSGKLTVDQMRVKFNRGGNESSFPIWTLLNGPLADALWHTGQVVSFRRTSGNPLHPGVSVFTGKTRE